jgi:hypothetical protein
MESYLAESVISNVKNKEVQIKEDISNLKIVNGKKKLELFNPNL